MVGQAFIAGIAGKSSFSFIVPDDDYYRCIVEVAGGGSGLEAWTELR